MEVHWTPQTGISGKAKRLEIQADSQQKEALREAAQDFEALFIQQLLQEMRRTVPEGTLFGNRQAEKLFESMLDEERAIEMARSQGLGLGDMIYRQLVDYVQQDEPALDDEQQK